jgi:hypothetical protein
MVLDPGIAEGPEPNPSAIEELRGEIQGYMHDALVPHQNIADTATSSGNEHRDQCGAEGEECSRALKLQRL